MTTKETSLSGLNTTQALILRNLLQQQQYPQLSVSPVYDVGSGISSAAAQIANALNFRRGLSQQNAMMDRLLQYEHQNALDAQTAKEQQAQHLLEAYQDAGFTPAQSQVGMLGAPAGVMENFQKSNQDAAQREQNIQNTMMLPGINVPVMPSSDQVYMGGSLDPTIINPMPRSDAELMVTQPNNPMAADLAKSYNWQRMQYLNANPDTVKGSNQMQYQLGFQPTNSYQMGKQKNDEAISYYDAKAKQAEAPFKGPQAAANVASTEAGIGLTNANTEGKRLDNVYSPAEHQSSIQGKNIGNETALHALKNKYAVEGLTAQAANNGDFSNPAKAPGLAAQISALRGDNPVPVYQSTVGNTYGHDPKIGIGMGLEQINAALQPPAPTAPGPTIQLPHMSPQHIIQANHDLQKFMFDPGHAINVLSGRTPLFSPPQQQPFTVNIAPNLGR